LPKRSGLELRKGVQDSLKTRLEQRRQWWNSRYRNRGKQTREQNPFDQVLASLISPNPHLFEPSDHSFFSSAHLQNKGAGKDGASEKLP
jgi:hypothetical protein